MQNSEEEICLNEDRLKQSIDRPIYQNIINSEAFLRLKEIRFLGAIDFAFHPNGKLNSTRHSRYIHSLGVADLAMRYAKKKRLGRETEQILVVSALLHDIGHPPLSHSMESSWNEAFGINHHNQTQNLILGFGSEAAKELSLIIKNEGIDGEEIIAILDKKHNGDFSEVFSSPINIDTIDGIVRCQFYYKNNNNKKSNDIMITRNSVLDAFISRKKEDASTLDMFWSLKQNMYSSIIQSREGLIFDKLSQIYLSEVLKRRRGDLYSKLSSLDNEKEFKKSHPTLFDEIWIASKIMKNEKELASLEQFQITSKERVKDLVFSSFEFVKRLFLVNKDVDISRLNGISDRYKQKKVKKLSKYDDISKESKDQLYLFEV